MLNWFFDTYYDIKRKMIHRKIKKICKRGGFEKYYCVEAIVKEIATAEKNEFYTRELFKRVLDHFYNTHEELRDNVDE